MFKAKCSKLLRSKIFGISYLILWILHTNQQSLASAHPPKDATTKGDLPACADGSSDNNLLTDSVESCAAVNPCNETIEGSAPAANSMRQA